MTNISRPPSSRAGRPAQGGMVLIEALMAMLIFSLGILGMVGVSAMALNAQSDAQYRTDANALTNDISQRIVLSVDRTTTASLQASLAAFQHQPEEDPDEPCIFTGAKASNGGGVSSGDIVEAWVASATGSDSALRMPGADDTMQQILVDTSTEGFNRLTVTVCWKTAGDAVPRRHSYVTLVN